jgi:hypothetical protein
VRTMIKRSLLVRFGRYVEAGLMRADVDLPAAVELLMGINFQLGFMHPEMMLTPKAELRRLVDAQAAMFARAVAPDAPVRPVAKAGAKPAARPASNPVARTRAPSRKTPS